MNTRSSVVSFVVDNSDTLCSKLDPSHLMLFFLLPVTSYFICSRYRSIVRLITYHRSHNIVFFFPADKNSDPAFDGHMEMSHHLAVIQNIATLDGYLELSQFPIVMWKC